MMEKLHRPVTTCLKQGGQESKLQYLTCFHQNFYLKQNPVGQLPTLPLRLWRPCFKYLHVYLIISLGHIDTNLAWFSNLWFQFWPCNSKFLIVKGFYGSSQGWHLGWLRLFLLQTIITLIGILCFIILFSSRSESSKCGYSSSSLTSFYFT